MLIHKHERLPIHVCIKVKCATLLKYIAAGALMRSHGAEVREKMAASFNSIYWNNTRMTVSCRVHHLVKSMVGVRGLLELREPFDISEVFWTFRWRNMREQGGHALLGNLEHNTDLRHLKICPSHQ